ncbi:endonuclease domain-containing protein [Actinoplanes sp. NPDC049599]|uniref:endonuclease domain-containing protein n=1 Tax=Actinoplanes sp. NPDC049599 TaxID=3363903 RepID=UPI003795D53D
MDRVCAQCGVVTSDQAVKLVGRGRVRGHVRLGRWRQLCPGVLLTSNGELTPQQQHWVAVLVAGRDALLAGAAAAVAGGLRGIHVGQIPVLIPAARGTSRRIPRLPPDMPAIRVHRSALLPAEHRRSAGIPRTTMARSVVDAAAWAPSDRAAVLTIAAACQQRLVRPEEIRSVLTVLTRVRRRRLVRNTLDDIAAGASALSELDLLTVCRRYDLPMPDNQQRRRDADGRHRYLDAYWREWRVLVEVDGRHHMDVREWAEDMTRQNRIWTAGDRILRFPSWLLRTDPEAVADQLREALRSH